MRRRSWLLTLPVAAGIAGCATHGLAFVQDGRVDLVTPADRATVELPVHVRWTAEDLPAGTTFGVAVDEALPRAGETAGDEVVRTGRTEVTLDHLGSTSRPGGRGTHQITVFLLDVHGRRVGESAWRVDVRLGAGS